MILDFQPLPLPPSQLGESPFWHPDQAALYWCDIPCRALHRWHPATASHRQWALDAEPGCCVPLPDGAVLVAQRDGLLRLDPATGARQHLADPPYDPGCERFNDGKADPQGRLWVGTVFEPRDAPRAALYRWGAGADWQRMAGDITVSNGLAFSPDGRTLYWSDTTSHSLYAFDFDGQEGSVSRQRLLRRFAVPESEPGRLPPPDYGGRPDGAAMDAEGCLWVAMYEGQRLLRLDDQGRVCGEWPLPVRYPTMPCFGGPDLRTLYLTTAQARLTEVQRAAQPWAGCVLHARVEIPGLPVHFAKLRS